MSRHSSLIALVALLAACTEPLSAPLSRVDGVSRAARVSDPTASWKIPTDDAALALRGDGLFMSAGYSEYANGVCGIDTRIFATTAGSNSGDATLQMNAPKNNNCRRRFLIVYPDGVSELVGSFNNLNKLHSSTSTIAVGTEALRRLILSPGQVGASRCGRVIFGSNGVVGDGTDQLIVRRVDARSWEVRSQDAPNDRALCESTGAIYNMRVSLVIVASRDLP